MTRREMIGEMIDYAVREASQNEKYNNIGMSQGEEAEIIVDLWIKFGSMTDKDVEKAYDKHIDAAFKCKSGDVFTLDERRYKLSTVSSGKMAMICLGDGNRWVDAVSGIDTFNVTKNDFKKLCGAEDWKAVYRTKEPYGGDYGSV